MDWTHVYRKLSIKRRHQGIFGGNPGVGRRRRIQLIDDMKQIKGLYTEEEATDRGRCRSNQTKCLQAEYLIITIIIIIHIIIYYN